MSTGNVRVVPITPAPNQPFLEMLFEDQWDRALVASFDGDPADPKLPAWKWQVAPAGTCLNGPRFDHQNTYFCPALFRPGIRRRRGWDTAVSLHAIIIDDAGTKIDETTVTDLLRCGPTYRIETSPGNFQVGWKTTGMTDMAWVKGMLVRLDQELGGRADNLVNPIALRRLPVGRNMKASLGLGPHGALVRARLIRPDRVVDMLDFLDLSWSGTITRMTTLNRGIGDSQRPDVGVLEVDPVYQALQSGDRIVGETVTSDGYWAVIIRCPWIDDHGPGRPLSGAVYVPAAEGKPGWFHCFHCERRGRGMKVFRGALDDALRAEGQKIVAAFEFDALPWAGASSGSKTSVGRALASYEPTEAGLTEAFVAEQADQLRFDHVRQKWYRWTGGFWCRDEIGRAFRWARELARRFRATQETELRNLAKIAVASAVERAARSDARLAVDGTSWDQDPWLAGAPGCEIDLRTGRVQPPDPAHLITRQLLVAPETMPTPLWDRFLWDSTGGDTELIRFLQAWWGYCLTGDISEEKFVFIYGPGGNGKGTLLFTVSAILNDYAGRAPAEMFMVRRHEGHPTEIARLMGVRAVTAAEIEEGKTFHATRLKDFTGRDGKLMGRFMRQDWFEFAPQFKVTFVGNNQPRIPNVDDAMRRRVILVPFMQKPAVADTTLKDRLVAEYPGILHWMIEGENLRRAMGGLSALIPAIARAATSAYLDDQDTLQAWATERCVFRLGDQTGVAQAFEDYRSWCFSRGDHPPGITLQEFSRKFLEAFPNCEKVRKIPGMVLVGVSLLPQDVGHVDP